MSRIRAAVLGGVDGVITSFAIVAGSSAGGLPMRNVLIVGSSSVVADGISMGISEFLSSTTERFVAARHDTTVNKTIATHPAVLGVLCFTTFVLFGAVPIAAFVLTSGSLVWCIVFSVVELLVLGGARTFMTKESIPFALAQTVLLGAVAGTVAFAIGHAVK